VSISVIIRPLVAGRAARGANWQRPTEFGPYTFLGPLDLGLWYESLPKTKVNITCRKDFHIPFIIVDAMPGKNYGATSFGERLQAIHRARGLTQVQLADAAETNQRAVSLAKAPKDHRGTAGRKAHQSGAHPRRRVRRR